MDAFHTLSGLQEPAVTAAQMREVDRIATTQVGPNLYQMMENAGRNLASLCAELLGDEWPAAPILVLAGTGGNGPYPPAVDLLAPHPFSPPLLP